MRAFLLLVALCLAAIGIGVGIESATSPQALPAKILPATPASIGLSPGRGFPLLSPVQLQIFLKPQATEPQITAIAHLIDTTPQIRSCRYVNKELSYRIAKRLFSGVPQAPARLTIKSTPAVFRCQLQSVAEGSAAAAMFYDPKMHRPVVPGIIYVIFSPANSRVS